MESAIAQCNDLAAPLITLGADVNTGINLAYSRDDARYKLTILDAVRVLLTQTTKELDKLASDENPNVEKEMFKALVAMGGWKAARGNRLLRIYEEVEEVDSGVVAEYVVGGMRCDLIFALL